MRRTDRINETYKLNSQSCDEIADRINGFCADAGADPKDVHRYRLSAEECLLYWLGQGHEGTNVVLDAGRHMFSNYFSLTIDAEAGNPYLDKNDMFGSFCDSILVSLRLSPEYSISDGRTAVKFRVKKKQRGQIQTLFIVIVAAIAFGLLGLLLPDGVRSVLLSGIIAPVYGTFFKILGCIAGPMIFLSVAWGVYGIGDTATLGQIGKKMMLRYTGNVFLTVACTTSLYPVLGPALSEGADKKGQFASIVDMILGIFPANIVEPFTSGNTLQIIFLAIVIGIALLYLGRQTSSIARAIEQINLMVQLLMEVISRLVPYVIFLVIINLIWSGDIAMIKSMWKLILAFAVMLTVVTLAILVYTSGKHKVGAGTLIRKGMPAFLVGLTTASSAAAFGINVSTCEKEYGIENSFISFGIPLGMVINKPVTGMFNLLLVFYFASHYGLSCSLGWIVAAVFVSSVVAIAAPPIPGGAAAAYSMLFMQLGIPSDALALTLALDMLLDFVITAFSVFILQMTLIDLSAGMGMIDKEILRNDGR